MLGTILGTQGNMDRRSPEQPGSGRLNVFFVTFQQGGSQRGVFWNTSCVSTSWLHNVHINQACSLSSPDSCSAEIANSGTLGLHVYKYYLHWVPKSTDITYNGLVGALGERHPRQAVSPS